MLSMASIILNVLFGAKLLFLEYYVMNKGCWEDLTEQREPRGRDRPVAHKFPLESILLFGSIHDREQNALRWKFTRHCMIGVEEEVKGSVQSGGRTADGDEQAWALTREYKRR